MAQSLHYHPNLPYPTLSPSIFNHHESSLHSPMAILLSLSHHPPPKPPHRNPKNSISPSKPRIPFTSKRDFIAKTTSLFLFTVASSFYVSPCSAAPSKSALLGIANTKSWFQFYGDGFSIRVPPEFQDIMEPEDDNAGLSLYGDKVKPKTFAARFASSDAYEVLSVVIKSTNQLKITFLEAKDISDLGSLKEAAKLFIPGGSTLYSAKTIKIKEAEGLRNYYFYEFGRQEQHIALVATVNSGKAIIAGATAPQSRWDEDGVRLRSAAISLTVT